MPDASDAVENAHAVNEIRAGRTFAFKAEGDKTPTKPGATFGNGGFRGDASDSCAARVKLRQTSMFASSGFIPITTSIMGRYEGCHRFTPRNDETLEKCRGRDPACRSHKHHGIGPGANARVRHSVSLRGQRPLRTSKRCVSGIIYGPNMRTAFAPRRLLAVTPTGSLVT